MLPTNRFFISLSLILHIPESACCVGHRAAWPSIDFLACTFEKYPEPARARGMAQFSQHLGFDLANAFASNREGLAHFLERVIGAVVQSKTHPDDSFLAWRERLQHGRHLFLQVAVDGRVRRRLNIFVFDEVAQMGLVFLSNRRLEA